MRIAADWGLRAWGKAGLVLVCMAGLGLAGCGKDKAEQKPSKPAAPSKLELKLASVKWDFRGALEILFRASGPNYATQLGYYQFKLLKPIERKHLATVGMGKHLRAKVSLSVEDLKKAGAKGKTTWVMEFEHKGATGSMEVSFDVTPVLETHGAGFKCVRAFCKSSFRDGSLSVEADEGTKVSFRGEVLTQTAAKSPLKFKALDPLAELTASIKGGKPLGRGAEKVVLTLPDGTVLETTIEIDVDDQVSHINDLLAKVKKGPVVFPGETPTKRPTPARKLAYFDVGKTTPIWIGKGGLRPDHLDLVAFAANSETKKNCGKFTGRRTGRVERFHIMWFTRTVTVYDRRTGRLVHTKRFAGTRPTCPKNFRGGLPDGSKVSSRNDAQWIRSLVGLGS